MLTKNYLLTHLEKDKTTCYRYLLVDPLKAVREDEPLALVNITDIFPSDEVMPILRPDLAYQPNSCPHLILLAKPNEELEPELLALALERANKEQTQYKHYVCGWLSSELKIQDLAESMLNLGNQLGHLISPNSPSFFPFYEHIRLQLLKESLSVDEVLSEQFNFVNCYIYMNYYGQLTEIAANNHSLDTPFLNTKQMLLQNRYHYQQDPKTIYGLVKIWQNNINKLPDNALFLSSTKLLQAKNIGLVNFEDQLIYSLYSLIYHSDLINVETIAPCIITAISEPGTLKSQFALLDSKIWQNISINHK